MGPRPADVGRRADLQAQALGPDLGRGVQERARSRPCRAPPWYTGVIKERAGDGAAGKWDIATIPGNGGNWGGSYLGIPEQSKHKAQAFELLKFLTGKEGEVAEFKAVGALPSNLKALDDPAVADSTNEYFNNAPVGKIYAGAAKDLKPIYLGPKHQQLWENGSSNRRLQSRAAEPASWPASAARRCRATKCGVKRRRTGAPPTA